VFLSLDVKHQAGEYFGGSTCGSASLRTDPFQVPEICSKFLGGHRNAPVLWWFLRSRSLSVDQPIRLSQRS
jgi:hypothetical protein